MRKLTDKELSKIGELGRIEEEEIKITDRIFPLKCPICNKKIEMIYHNKGTYKFYWVGSCSDKISYSDKGHSITIIARIDE